MSDVLKQGDPRWSKHKLGSSTIGKVGCLATVYAQAASLLGTQSVTPIDVVERGVFKGAAMLQQDTAKRLGLIAGDVTHAGAAHRDMRGELLSSLLTKALVVMHVDHDSESAKGDVDGDHFVLALHIDGADIVFADPATGNEERMDTRMLACPVMWGSTIRHYQVRSVRPLRRAQ